MYIYIYIYVYIYIYIYISSKPRTFSQVGTPDYMAPELLLG